MVRCPNIVQVSEKEAFFLVHLDPEDEEALMDGLKGLGVEGEARVVYCG